jgi:hypothetical protein
MKENPWARLLAYVTGLINQELLLKNEYLAAENRILRAHLSARLRILPVPPGPRNNASSRLPMKAQVARSKTRLRFIFGLKVKSKLSSVLLGSRNAACLRHRSKQALTAPGQFICDQT